MNDKFEPTVLKKASDNGGNLPPLFLFPSITGDGPSDYGQIGTALRKAAIDQAVYAFKAPGLIDTSYNTLTIQQLIDHYYNLLKKTQPKDPYYLGGWSSGALIAYGVAQKLKENGNEIRYLALIDEAAPRKEYDQQQFAHDLFELVKHLPANASHEITEKNLSNKSCEEQVAFVFKNLTPKENMVPKSEDTLAIVKQFLLGLLQHEFKKTDNTEIHIFYTDKTLQNNANNVKLNWDQYGNVAKTTRVGEDHLSPIKQPQTLVEEIASQIKLHMHTDSEKNVADRLCESSSANGILSSPVSLSIQNLSAAEENTRIFSFNRLMYLTVTKVFETPCNALAVLKLLQIMIEWYTLAIDKIASECNTSVPEEYKDDEVVFNKAVLGILKRLDEKAFHGQPLPEWLKQWIEQVKGAVATRCLDQEAIALLVHLLKLQKISYHAGTDKLDAEIEKLKDNIKVKEFLTLAKKSGEAIYSLSKGDTKPFYIAIISRTMALDNKLKGVPEADFTRLYFNQ